MRIMGKEALEKKRKEAVKEALVYLAICAYPMLFFAALLFAIWGLKGGIAALAAQAAFAVWLSLGEYREVSKKIKALER